MSKSSPNHEFGRASALSSSRRSFIATRFLVREALGLPSDRRGSLGGRLHLEQQNGSGGRAGSLQPDDGLSHQRLNCWLNGINRITVDSRQILRRTPRAELRTGAARVA